MAFDFGERFVGVAIGESMLGVAHPLEAIDAEANEQRFAAIAALVGEWSPVLLVVGLPLAIDGTEREMTRRARRFGRQLEGRFHLPVIFIDERLSSAEASAMLREQGRSGKSDKNLNHPVAAQVILQAYFNEHPAS
ncbi:MAG TPA: Holliday junction resolvase RuvX [Burkholderiales bacterium]|nr:Holliday junction resolvase RuvX [Burkholderiales bacterium]